MNSAAIKIGTGKFNQDRARDNMIMVLAALLLSVLTSILFYLEALGYNGGYPSDLPAHISQAMYIRNYSIVFILMKWVFTWTHYLIYSMGLLQGLTVGVAMICTTLTIEKLFDLDKYVSMAISFCLLFLTNIYVPYLFPRYYKGSIISQPWHNITYNSMRPIAVLTMLSFAYLHEIYKKEKRIAWNYWIITCLLLVLATMVKPNFLMGFAPGLLVFLLIDFFGKRNTFKNEFLLGCVVLPAIAVLPIQARLLFDSANGIIFAPSIFFFDDGPVIFIMKFVTALPLPIMVYIYNRHRLINGAGVAGWGYIWSVLEGMFIMEDGLRQTHGNFLWGLEIMGYILFMYVYSMFIRDFKEYRNGTVKKTGGRTVYFIVGFILMALHVITGFRYFIWVCRGYHFYV